jgi:hypothetical protein
MARADDARVELADREDRLTTTRMQVLCDMIDHIAKRLEVLEAQRDAQAKADAEAEELRIQAELDQLPDPDQPAAHGHFNTGDLSPLPPTVDADNEGDLPKQLEKGAAAKAEHSEKGGQAAAVGWAYSARRHKPAARYTPIVGSSRSARIPSCRRTGDPAPC